MSAIRAAKMEALARYHLIRRNGAMTLNADVYKDLAHVAGLSRADVAHAVDDLVEAGRAHVSGSDGSVVVELTEWSS